MERQHECTATRENMMPATKFEKEKNVSSTPTRENMMPATKFEKGKNVLSTPTRDQNVLSSRKNGNKETTLWSCGYPYLRDAPSLMLLYCSAKPTKKIIL